MSDSTRQENIGKYGLICIFAFCLIGVMFGMFHDFSPEYEEDNKYGPPQWVYNESTDTVRSYREGEPYPTEIYVDENGNGHTSKEWNLGSENYIISGGTIIALTKLDEDGMKIQKEKGCNPCHNR